MSVFEETYKKKPMIFLTGMVAGIGFTCTAVWALFNTYYLPKMADLEKSVVELKQKTDIQPTNITATATKPVAANVPTMSQTKRKTIIKQLDTEIADKEAQRVGLAPLMGNEPPSAAYNRLIAEIEALKAKRLELMTGG